LASAVALIHDLIGDDEMILGIDDRPYVVADQGRQSTRRASAGAHAALPVQVDGCDTRTVTVKSRPARKRV